MILERFKLNGKKALVTGASRGLGQAIAIGLAQAGAYVICSSSRENGCSETVKEIQSNGGTAIDIQANLGDEKKCRSFW